MRTKIIGILAIMLLIAPTLSLSVSADGPQLRIKPIDEHNQLIKFNFYIENVGTEESDEVFWDLKLIGGHFFTSRDDKGYLPSLESGSGSLVRSNRIFGLGRCSIELMCGEVFRDADGNVAVHILHDVQTYDLLVIGFFIIIL